MTDEELIGAMLVFIEDQEGDYFDEWYATPRDYAAIILTDFAKYINLELVVPEYVPRKNKKEVDRNEILKALMPAISKLFEQEYKKIMEENK
jgi:hypothetical protein